MIIFLALLAIPLIEIALFIVVGDAIGLWPTLGIVIVTALIGSFALRQQGFATLARFRSMNNPDQASTVLIEGVLLMAAGLLLVTPGVLTDAIGLALLIPSVRRIAAEQIARRAVTIVTRSATRDGGGASPTGAPDGPPPGGPGHRPKPDAPSGGRAAATEGPDAPARSPFRKRGRVIDAEDAIVINESTSRGGRSADD